MTYTHTEQSFVLWKGSWVSTRFSSRILMQKKLKIIAVKYLWLCKKSTPKHAVLQKAIRKCAIQRSQRVVGKKGLHFFRGSSIRWEKPGDHSMTDVSRWIPRFSGEPSLTSRVCRITSWGDWTLETIHALYLKLKN